MRSKTPLRAAGMLCAALIGYGTLAGCVPLAEATLREHVIPWSDYEITGPHEITVTVHGGDPRCETTRAVSTEQDGVLSIGVIRGYPVEAPQNCLLLAHEEKLIFTTIAPADTVTLRQMSAAEAGL